MDTQIQYDIGRTAAFDAMEDISYKADIKNPVPSIAGFVTAALQACFGMAPNEKEANKLIRICIKDAIENEREVL
jgi:hypothetical protein